VWTGTRRTTVPSYDTTIQILPYHGLTGSPVASPSPHCTRTAIPPSIVLDRTWPTLHAPRSSIDHGQQQCRPKQHHTPGCRDSSGVGMHALSLVRTRMRCRFVPGSTILGPLHPGSCHQPISSVLCPRSSVFLTEHMVRGRPSGMAGGRIIAWKRQRSVVFRSAST
jgi:hypothetical protein